MPPFLAIVQLSTSFEHIWEPLAKSAGAVARTIAIDDASRATEACAIIIAAGGAEHDVASAVRKLRELHTSAPIVVGAALGDHRVAIDAIQAGADEYFALPGDMERFATWLPAHVHHSASIGSATAQPRFDFSRIVGRSRALRATLELTSRIIPHGDANVVITGETGTGKELIAQAIHHNGPRASHALVDINCAALPANLVEAELFGYEAGAFTDARSAKPGLLEAAQGGTLLLDEVAELPIELQAKLLRVLDDRRVRRLGATRSTPIDVRIISATHADLASAVAEGRFRQDLFYRLNVLAVHLPPLRERGDDVLLLAEHFARQLHHREDRRRLVIDDTFRRVLLRHSWPGNVRELRNAIERAAVLGRSSLLPADDLATSSRAPSAPLPFPADMESIQQAAARAMVGRHRGNKSAAAAALGISRKRLYSLLENGDRISSSAVPVPPPRLSAFVQETPPKGRAVDALSSALWLRPAG